MRAEDFLDTSEPPAKLNAAAFLDEPDPETLEGVLGKGPEADTPSYLRPELKSPLVTASKVAMGPLGMTELGDRFVRGGLAGLNRMGEGILQTISQIAGRGTGVQEAARNVRDIDRGVAELGGAAEAGKFVGENALTAVSPARALPTLAAAAAQGFTRADDTGEKTLAERGIQAGTESVLGGTAATGIKATGKAISWLRRGKGVDVSGKALGDASTGVDDIGRAKDIQTVLKTKYSDATAAEDAAWDAVRKEVSGQALTPQQAKPLMESLQAAQANMVSNDAAGAVDRQLARLSRFVANGQDVPAAELLGIRSTLSKASAKDGGVWEAVKTVDQFIDQNLKVASLPKALGLSRKRFQVFDDRRAVAAAVAEEATPERFGRVLLGSGTPANAVDAAQYVGDILTAAGKEAPKVQALVDQAVSHRILQVARSGDGEKIWIGKVANEITNLRRKNPSLWEKLSPDARSSLEVLETNLRKEGEAGRLTKVAEFALGTISRGIRPFGISTNLRLPSAFAPKTVADLQQLINVMRLRPEMAEKGLGTLSGKPITVTAPKR